MPTSHPSSTTTTQNSCGERPLSIHQALRTTASVPLRLLSTDLPNDPDDSITVYTVPPSPFTTIAQRFPFSTPRMSSYSYSSSQLGDESIGFSPLVFEKKLNPVYFGQYLPAAEPMDCDSPVQQPEVLVTPSFLLEDSEDQTAPVTSPSQNAHEAQSPPPPTPTPTPTTPSSAASTPASWPSPASHPSSTTTSPPTSCASPSPPSSPASQASYTCADCGAAFRLRGELNKHRNRKHIKRFMCTRPGCGAAFHLKTDLGKHMTSVKCGAEETVRIRCGYEGCEETFSRKDNMDRHVRETHEHGSRRCRGGR